MHRTILSFVSRLTRVAPILFLLGFSGFTKAEEDAPVVVFSAASTTRAIDLLVAAFTQETGIAVVVSYGSSAALARQIDHGAPADLYLSANLAWLDYLGDQSLLVADSASVLATNQLAVIVPTGAPLPEGETWSGTLFNALGDEGRLALGDPDHVPAGIYARQALEAADLWTALAPRLARTSDVRGALALVSRGEAAAGLVYATDALITDAVAVAAEVPDALHEPIVYIAAVVTGERQRQAQALLAFMTGPQGAAAFAAAGFGPAP